MRVVYTAIFGRRDRLWNPLQWPEGVEFICFTDDPNLREWSEADDRWNIVLCHRREKCHRRSAKWYKVQAHRVLDCEESLWLDGSLQLNDLRDGWEHMQNDIALTPHPDRQCIYTEAARVIHRKQDSREIVDAAVERYRELGHPENWGLWRGGVIWRKHTPEVARFNETWWQHIREGSVRDQISLPPVLRYLGMPFDIFPRSVPSLTWRSHPLREGVCYSQEKRRINREILP